jgi:Transposase DDE domain
MDEKIIAMYCLCDDLLKALHHPEDTQRQMTDAEVMTLALVAALFLRGNHESARLLCQERGLISPMLSKSRYNRRLHNIKDMFIVLLNLLGTVWKELNTSLTYVMESFPVAVCDNYRIPRAKIYRQEAYRGYIASKKRYCYGVKIHLMITKDGQPIEMFLSPGSFGDVEALKCFSFDLPAQSIVYGDKAYNDYEIEDLLREVDHIVLRPIRKKNSKRALPPYVEFVQHYQRKMVETAGSLLERLLPKSIHAVTAEGFELKVALFVVAHSVACYISDL